jgi:dUTP pyrophosphatase
MGKIIDIEQAKETFVKKELTDNVLGSIINGDSNSMTEILAVLLALPDEEFELITPTVIDYFEKSVNNPADKLLLTQSLNAQGLKAEDLNELLGQLFENINKIDAFSTAKKDFLKQLVSSITNAIMDTEGIAKKFVSVAIEKCHPDAIVPQYANTSDSGMDLYALEDYVIAPGETKLIPTGIKIALPPGYELQVRPKSGRALKTKLRVANTPGTVDAGYRDEIKVIIENIEAPIKDIGYEFDDDGHIKITSILHGTNQYIGKGEKFAQLVLMEVPKAVFYAVDNVSAIEGDRGGGFGSTGLK